MCNSLPSGPSSIHGVTVNGVSAMGLTGNFFLDGTLTGTMMQAGTVELNQG